MKVQWIRDLETYIAGVPYGAVEVKVVRHNRNTAQVVAVGSETLRYTDNNECVKDLLGFITSLLDDNHSGSVDFTLDMKDGNIKLLTIKNTKTTNY